MWNHESLESWPQGGHLLASASSLETLRHHLSSTSLTLGDCSSTGWLGATTISLPGCSPIGLMLT